MDNHQTCPICADIPEKEIYQCVGGHIICHICIEKLKSCPQCREPFGDKKIRNRVLEQLLDKQDFDCFYVECGCKEKLNRQEISEHAETCSKKPFSICKALGYENCNYALPPFDWSCIIKHFKEQHGAASENTNELWIRHANFKSCVETTTNKKWGPILLAPKDAMEGINSIFVIIGSVYVSKKSVSWICLEICDSAENPELHYEAEFKFLDGEGKKTLFKWTLPVLKIQGLALDNAMENCPVQIPFSFIKSQLGEISDIPISVVVKLSNQTETVDLLRNPTEVWIVSSEKKGIEKTPGVSHFGITCDVCHQQPILGKRHRCLQCLNYDLCENCMRADSHVHHIFATFATHQQGQVLRSAFAQIQAQLSPRARQGFGIVHFCGGCHVQLGGKRYYCLQCQNYELCEDCMSKGIHSNHLFAIVRTLGQRITVGCSFPRSLLSATPGSDDYVICPLIICNKCGAQPIRGKQYKCFECSDYDLCGSCVSRGTHSSHILIMISTREQRQLLRTHFDRIRF